jgi:SNF2-related domain
MLPDVVSPLFQIRWYRLIVDEGHNTANVTTNFNFVMSKMSVQCRWVMTGTPTPHLIGSVTSGRSAQSAESQQAESLETSEAREWIDEEEKDLKRMEKMIGESLRIEPFYSRKGLFEEQVIRPLRRGSMFATRVLSQVMQHVMVRHP